MFFFLLVSPSKYRKNLSKSAILYSNPNKYLINFLIITMRINPKSKLKPFLPINVKCFTRMFFSSNNFKSKIDQNLQKYLNN